MLKKMFLFICLSMQLCHAQNVLDGHEQVLVVVTPDWDSTQGVLKLYERNDDQWKAVSEPISVVVGKSGLAWGIGLHTTPDEAVSHKREGDMKAPAGIFSLGKAFGIADEMPGLQIEYINLQDGHEAVDDVNSMYYNQIVNREEIAIPDWNSSERMKKISLYAIGLTVDHNFPNPVKGAGSAIFLHIWRSALSGTAGCTAMSEEALRSVLFWLEENKKPLLVQLPVETYEQWQEEYHLPLLN